VCNCVLLVEFLVTFVVASNREAKISCMVEGISMAGRIEIHGKICEPSGNLGLHIDLQKPIFSCGTQGGERVRHYYHTLARVNTV
jgi:hypothetical protein